MKGWLSWRKRKVKKKGKSDRRRFTSHFQGTENPNERGEWGGGRGGKGKRRKRTHPVGPIFLGRGHIHGVKERGKGKKKKKGGRCRRFIFSCIKKAAG